MGSEIIRATTSTGPPAENGTTIVMGRAGYACANALAQQAESKVDTTNRNALIDTASLKDGKVVGYLKKTGLPLVAGTLNADARSARRHIKGSSAMQPAAPRASPP